MRVRRLDVVLVVLLAAILYANSLRGPFSDHDIVEIRDNPRVHALVRVPDFAVHRFLERGSGHNPLYRPLTAVVTTLVWVAGGGAALPFHVLVVLLHALASSLVLLLLFDLTEDRVVALTGALLFAAHPVHTEAVAWISGEAELLSAGSVLSAWLLHRRGRILFAGLAAGAGMFAKEGAVVFPALAIAGDLLTRRPLPPRAKAYMIDARARHHVSGGTAGGVLGSLLGAGVRARRS